MGEGARRQEKRERERERPEKRCERREKESFPFESFNKGGKRVHNVPDNINNDTFICNIKRWSTRGKETATEVRKLVNPSCLRASIPLKVKPDNNAGQWKRCGYVIIYHTTSFIQDTHGYISLYAHCPSTWYDDHQIDLFVVFLQFLVIFACSKSWNVVKKV